MGIRLKLGGKPFSLTQPKPSVVVIKKFLDAAATDEIFTSQSLKDTAKVSNFDVYVSDLAEYTQKLGRVRYWGHPKAIAELRRQVGQ